MQTPDTDAGRWTEEVMAEWLRRLDERREPRPNTATYNAAYEATLVVLDRRLPRTKGTTKSKPTNHDYHGRTRP